MNEEKIIEEITAVLRDLDPKIYSALLIGGVEKKKFVPGWSDIDLIIVLDYPYLTPRSFYEKLSRGILESREKLEPYIYDSETEVGIHDKSSVVFGKYCYMNPNFKENIKILLRHWWV